MPGKNDPPQVTANPLADELDGLIDQMLDLPQGGGVEPNTETLPSDPAPEVASEPDESERETADHDDGLADTFRDLPLHVVRAVDLREPPQNRWLIEDYIGEEACIVLGAAPKSYKTWTALSMAAAVTSGRPFLGRPVQQGRVLAYYAEDPEWVVRERLAKICRAEGLALEDLDSMMIKDSSLRLNDETDRQRLRETISILRPRLLILDPYVRIVAGLDENNAMQVSGVLGYLRATSREFGCAILLAHHTRKNPGKGRAAESLRGSGDFFAWADSVLSLRKLEDGEHALLQAEHRFAMAPDPVVIQLDAEDEAQTHLVLGSADLDVVASARPEEDLDGRVLDAITQSDEPLTNERLRSILQCKMARLVDAVAKLEADEKICRPTRQGWVLAVGDRGDYSPDGREDGQPSLPSPP